MCTELLCACAAHVVLWTSQHKLVAVWFVFCVHCIQVLEELHHLHHCSFVSRVEGNHRFLECHISRWVNAHNGYILRIVHNLFWQCYLYLIRYEDSCALGCDAVSVGEIEWAL